MRKQVLARCFTLVVALALCGCGQSGSTPDSAESNATPSGGQTQTTSAPAPAPAPPPKPIVVDAGTVLNVTVDEAVSSKTNNPGDHFAASLAAPVLVGGKEVIPSGSKVSGTVTVAKSAGRFKGNAELSVTLDTVTVGGRTYQLQTSAVEEASKGRGKRTAIGAGAGAAAGAVIGVLAGGGKGAAIGAGAGAGAGTATAALTGNRDIDIPAETKLSFNLTQPLELRAR